MPLHFLPRATSAALLASLSLLASCGGGTVASQFSPARILAVGDASGDLGQDGALYTINDGSVNNWTSVVADSYGLALRPSAAGGLSRAIGNARVNTHPDAAGDGSTPTVKEQVDALLAATPPGSSDLVILTAGTSDVIAEAQSFFTGSQTEAQMLANISQAGTDFGAQVQRLVNAGATHVMVVGPYNLGKSVWAQQLDQSSLLESASTRFNQSLLVSISTLGDTVLYVDAAYYFNLVANSPTSYSLSEVSTAACTSVDAGAGIGTGSGQLDAHLCSADTLLSGIDPAVYLFADRVYLTPIAQRLFGAYAYDKIHDRW